MIKATIGEVDLSPDGENVNITCSFYDENGDGLTEKPSVFQMGLDEFQAGNLDEVIRQRASQIQEEIDRKAAVAAKAEAFADVIAQAKADLEDRSFDVSDTSKPPVKIDFTSDQLRAKDAKAQAASGASAQLKG